MGDGIAFPNRLQCLDVSGNAKHRNNKMLNVSFENIGFYIIIAIPTFFILRRLLKKIIKTDLFRNITTLILTLLLTPLLFFGVVYTFLFILFHEPSRKFDKTSWQSESGKRFQMADDIIKRKILIGKDTTQIKDLLGDTNQKFQDSSKQLHWTYEMGEGGGGLGFLFHSLEINFKNNKTVTIQHSEIRD